MKSHLPKSIAIDGETWAVSYTRRKPAWISNRREKFIGYTDSDSKRIWVQRTGKPEEDSQTLVHEIDHALNMAAAETNDTVRLVLTGDLEEHIVMAREKPMWRTLRDNDWAWTRTKWEGD